MGLELLMIEVLDERKVVNDALSRRTPQLYMLLSPHLYPKQIVAGC